jgi:hypothetical protein
MWTYQISIKWHSNSTLPKIEYSNQHEEKWGQLPIDMEKTEKHPAAAINNTIEGRALFTRKREHPIHPIPILQVRTNEKTRSNPRCHMRSAN